MKAAEIQELEERQKSLVKGQRELQTSLEGTTKALIKNQKAYQDLADEIDRVLTKINNLKGAQGKMQNRVVEEDSREIIGSQQENDSFWKTPWKVGLLNMAGKSVANLGEAYLNSWLGPTTGNQISTVLGSVVSGVVMGSVGGLPGAVIGGLVGGVAGIANAAVQTFTNQDEAYKAAAQEFYSDAMEKQKQSLQNGTAIAARRETDQISISRLLREDADVQGYMESIQQEANATPFQYEELVSLSKTLAPGFGDDTDRMLKMLQVIGDAGFAVEMDENGRKAIATALNQMEVTDKATLESLKQIQGQGIDAYGALAASLRDEQGNELSVEEALELVSKGEISGEDAVEALIRYLTDPDKGYAGAMEEQSRTYAGLTSTVEGLWNNIDAAMGAGYTEKRKEGLTAEVDWLGENSEGMEKIYSQIGQYQAELENEKQRLYLEAMETAAAEAEAQELTGAAAGEALAKAEMEARAKYLTSDGYREFEDSQLRIVRTAQESALIGDAWQSLGYRMGLEFEKGMNSVIGWGLQSFADRTHREARREVYGEENFLPGDPYAPGFGAPQAVGIANQAVHLIEEETALPNAWGLDRVPYDGYRAILHEGEQVLTAREARKGRNVAVNFAGANFSVREEADIDRIAQEIVAQISRAAMLAGV
ncbi:MAG: hypothetical protein HFJ86_08805 [Oscillospiraceae bacterium]|nr:hypothetical protein [Oscillospiraceae bacterium]